MNERTLEVLADEVLELYVNWKRQIIYKYSAVDSDRKACRKVAELCMENNMEPKVFMAAQVENQNPERYRAPFLYGKYAMGKYKMYKEKITEVPVGNLYEHYNGYLINLMMQGHTHQSVLASDHYQFPAWYRVVVTTQPDEAIIAKYADKARKEIQLNPSIEQFIMEEPTLTDALERLRYGRQL